MKKIVVFFALALISLPIFAGEFEQQIQSIVTKYKLPGASVLRSQNGKIDVGEVVGVRKLGDTTKISSNDKFHLGSCTKAMTATLVAKLIEEGRLTWTTTAHDVLGKVHQDHQNVTIEMLLAHRGGTTGDLLKYRDGDLWKKLWNQSLNPMSGRQLVFEEVMGYKADATPGTQYIYSNAGYIIAGAMLEKITGKSWETLMREKIFMPLSMHSCGFGAPAAVSEIPDQPWGHQNGANGVEPKKPGFYADNPPSLGPAGTVNCSLGDWLKFLQAHMDGYRGKENIIKADSYKKLHTHYPQQDYTYGGWFKVNRGWAGVALNHSGTNTYNYVNVWLAPEKNLAILAAINYGGGEAHQATDEMVGALIPKNK